MENFYAGDNCRSKSEFIEKAINFYVGYLKAEGNSETVRELHKMCVDEVWHINGAISLESAVEFQNE